MYQLNINWNQVHNLKPIGALKYLQMLFANQNQIENLEPLKKLKQLQFLDLNHNHIEDLTPLASVESLEALSIMNNRVKDLTPITKLPHLLALLAQGNQITSLKGIQALPIISLENQSVEWESIWVNKSEYAIELKGRLIDTNGEVPLITAISPKTVTYDVLKSRLIVNELEPLITVFFHNQNEEIPFSGELRLSFKELE